MPAVGNGYCSNSHCSLYHLNLCKPEHELLKGMWHKKGWDACLREIKWRIVEMFQKNSKTPKGRYWSRNPFWIARELQEIIDKLKK